MAIIKKMLYVILMVCFIVECIIPANVYAIEKINVLFISSFNNNFVSFADQVNGIMSGLNNNVNLQTEYMDFKIFDSDENEEAFYNLIKYKLSTYDKFDAIIVGDDDALEFAIKYRNDLLKDIPLVFLGVENEELRMTALEYELVSGVTEVESVYENIDLIKVLHNNVRNIVFFYKSSESELINRYYDSLALKYTDLKFQILDVSNLTVKEFKAYLETLDSKDAIISFYAGEFKDVGKISIEEFNRLINETANNIPIYDIISYDAYYGSVGGKVINHYNQGEKAGQIVQGILEGKDPKELYISDDSANEYIFDYKVLKEFGIGKSSLPEGSKIVNKPIDMLREQREIVISVVLLVIILLTVIVSLVICVIYRSKYERELLRSIKISQQANRLKESLISNISHELKTPINVIMSAVQLAKLKEIKSNSNKKQSNINEVIENNCYRLLRLTNNVLDVAKLDSGDICLDLKKVNIVEVLEDIVQSVRCYVENKGLEITFDTTDEEVIMDIDYKKIERAVLNILSNSLKFSKNKGTIKVTLEAYKDKVVFSIEDDGIGIDKEHLNIIFSKFVQIDDSLTRRNEGSGIGLTIVKGFIELHGGNVKIKSNINCGTKVIVELPIIAMDKENTESSLHISREFPTEISTKIELADIYL